MTATLTTAVDLAMVALVMVTAAVRLATEVALVMATAAVRLAMAVALVMATAAVQVAMAVALVMATAAVQVAIGNSISERLMITHAFASLRPEPEMVHRLYE
jgi:hypothetical protein